MTSLRIAFVAGAVVALVGCNPPTCEPQPIAAGYEEAKALLPPSAVVCATPPDANPKNPGVFMQFPTRDVKALTYEAMLKLRAADWVLDKNSEPTDLGGYITGSRKGRMLSFTINKQAGGPYAGRVTGDLHIVGDPL